MEVLPLRLVMLMNSAGPPLLQAGMACGMFAQVGPVQVRDPPRSSRASQSVVNDQHKSSQRVDLFGMRSGRSVPAQSPSIQPAEEDERLSTTMRHLWQEYHTSSWMQILVCARVESVRDC
mmetsp:Transcript_73696/g.238607  ORF Transcript_73696/g.238607 Transcript_73696/m.238607 type:complete len:120 (-) Transcript_73696:250-609(-)